MQHFWMKETESGVPSYRQRKAKKVNVATGIICVNERWTVVRAGSEAGKHPKDSRVKHHKTSEQKGALGTYQISKTHRNLEKWAALSHSMRNINLEEVKLLKVTLCGAKHHENQPPPLLQRRMQPPFSLQRISDLDGFTRTQTLVIKLQA